MYSKIKLRLNNLNPSIIFLILAIIIGSLIRLVPILNSSFPINDGGLFFTITNELISERFRIPIYINYNSLQIPFAYPPLGFYLVGGIHKLTGWELIDIFRVLPVFFSIMAIFALYLLAKVIIQDDFSVGVSVLIFSFLPATMEWLVMGGGITRAPGFVFFLLTLRSAYLCFTRFKWFDVILTVVFSSITVLFHPEAAIHTAASIFVFLLFKGRSKKGLLKTVIILFLVLLMTSPWWLQVIENHGLLPFIAAVKTGMHTITNYLNFLLFNITKEYGLSSIGVLAFFGIFFYLAKHQFMLPVWTLVLFLTDPRSASLYEAPVLAFLAGVILSILLKKLDNLSDEKLSTSKNVDLLSGVVSRLCLTFLIIQWVFSATTTVISEVLNYTLLPSDISAMEWVKENTPPDSDYLIISGMHPFWDASSEWFPTLTNSNSIATVQGYEWLAQYDFNKIFNNSLELQECIFQDLDCLRSWQESSSLDFQFIYLRKYTTNRNYGQTQVFGLYNSLLGSNNFTLIHETDSVFIFKNNDYQ